MRVPLLLLLGVCLILSSDHVAFAQAAGPPGGALTESEALRRLAQHDPRIRAIRARIDETRALQSGRVVRANPSVSFSRESVGDAHDGFLLGRQEIDVSGRLGRLREAGRLALRAAEAEARQQIVERQALLRHTFVAALLAQERVASFESGIRDLQQLLDVLRTRETAGEGSSYDRLRGQRALADMEADLGLALIARADAQGRLAAMLGGGSGQVAEVSNSLEPAPPAAHVSALIEHALANRGDLQAEQMSLEQYRVEQSAAKRLAIPTPTLTGGLKRSSVDEHARSGYLFSLDLSVPLFNRGQPAASLAAAQTVSSEARLAAVRQQIDAEVRTAHTTLTIHHQRSAQYRAATMEVTELLATVARIGYEEGELGILELLDAVRQTMDGRLRLLDLAASARRAAIELDRATGREIQP
jgi:cobalt-zinc-cadmium efflux system outer membrane protein